MHIEFYVKCIDATATQLPVHEAQFRQPDHVQGVEISPTTTVNVDYLFKSLTPVFQQSIQQRRLHLGYLSLLHFVRRGDEP